MQLRAIGDGNSFHLERQGPNARPIPLAQRPPCICLGILSALKIILIQKDFPATIDFAFTKL
jgi:hypothetical protein